MTISEKFKVWLNTIYTSERTGKPINSVKHYEAGIRSLNKKLNLTGEGIFENNADLIKIENLVNNLENIKKTNLSHFKAFLKFRNYITEINNKSKKPLQRQVDVFKRQRVEISAIEKTIEYFENLDYIVISKEKDNVGWDLEATNNKETLLLEVKGLSGKTVSVELSPNEYQKSNEFKGQYKLCIVTNALNNPNLEIFSYDFENKKWKNIKNEKLIIEERISAKMYKE
jgi:hypothetical protein